MAKKHIAAGTTDYPAHGAKTRTARVAPAASGQAQPYPVSRAKHGRPDGALLAGGLPWQHDTVVQGGVRHAPPTDNSLPSDIPGDCPGD